MRMVNDFQQIQAQCHYSNSNMSPKFGTKQNIGTLFLFEFVILIMSALIVLQQELNNLKELPKSSQLKLEDYLAAKIHGLVANIWSFMAGYQSCMELIKLDAHDKEDITQDQAETQKLVEPIVYSSCSSSNENTNNQGKKELFHTFTKAKRFRKLPVKERTCHSEGGQDVKRWGRRDDDLSSYELLECLANIQLQNRFEVLKNLGENQVL
eukprot:TRINITY_DN3277_c0_g1_i3.p1 TRINITY_DN3277_c0_g1~~TRINITY_DN3277_c0_g1_i3.p1  ORF type:complete len:210 (-),score=17.65 TRINITY_DN3277_c0_g1_i3:182-811(-)